VTEAKSTHDEEFGAGRLEAFIEKHRSLDVSLLNAGFLNEVRRFTGGTLHDDIFILTIDTK